MESRKLALETIRTEAESPARRDVEAVYWFVLRIGRPPARASQEPILSLRGGGDLFVIVLKAKKKEAYSARKNFFFLKARHGRKGIT